MNEATPLPIPFRIKICGITRVEDVDAACDAGADAIGLNFYPRSSRFVTPEVARRLRDRAGDRAQVIGVWVNEPTLQIERMARDLALDGIQLHGDEPLETLERLAGWTVIRALRHPFSAEDLAMLRLAAAQAYRPAAVLIDAAVAGQYGGTGARTDWEAVHQQRAALGGFPMVLAGGLSPDVVSQAIRQAKPDAVDVASGVESTPGIKEAEQIQRFVAAAHQAASWW